MAALIVVILVLVGYGLWHRSNPDESTSPAEVEHIAVDPCVVVVTDGITFADELTVGPKATVGFAAACPVEIQNVQLVVTDSEGVITIVPLQAEGATQTESGLRSLHQWQLEIPESVESEMTFTFYAFADGQPSGDPVRLTMSPRG